MTSLYLLATDELHLFVYSVSFTSGYVVIIAMRYLCIVTNERINIETLGHDNLW